MIEIQGLDKLIGKLGGMEDKGGKAVDRGIGKGLKAIQGQAKLLCAVDTGDLRNSIKTSEVNNHQGEVYTNSDHGIFVEFGTGTKGDPDVPHTAKESWTYMGADGKFHVSHGMKPQPFMRPAAEFGKEEVPGIIAEELRKELEHD